MARRQRFNYMEPIKPEWCEADNKYIYANKVEAERAARRAFAERGDEVRVYQGNPCGHWHLTKSAQW